jgi:hypothetical protein
MKRCLVCGADVEGLLYYCDCCGASLEVNKKRFFTCVIYELPQCLGFSSLAHEMVDALQPENSEKYESFLSGVGIGMICYPESIIADGNIKNRLQYSQKKKYAKLTIVVNFNEFVYANKEKKASLVATALLQGVHLLQTRLSKCQFSINDIVFQAEALLSKHIT